jgi:BirA family biotin operon repressor/biotin-[acetyl-CoA-carboxylase] ligase
MALIDPVRVRKALADAGAYFHIESLDSCDSTNACLLIRIAEGAPSGLVLTADRQTAGRGRRERSWKSTPEGSLTFSMLWRFAPGKIGGLSLAIGLALLYALEKFGAKHLALKWPNDLLFVPPEAESGKLAGILIELVPVDKKVAVVIGIGLNLCSPDGIPAAGLADCLPLMPPRDELLVAILLELQRALAVLEAHGFAALRHEWQTRHAYQDCAVNLQDSGCVKAEGICRGVDDEGALLLEIPGTIELSRFFAGDLSLRPKLEGDAR